MFISVILFILLIVLSGWCAGSASHNGSILIVDNNSRNTYYFSLNICVRIAENHCRNRAFDKEEIRATRNLKQSMVLLACVLEGAFLEALK